LKLGVLQVLVQKCAAVELVYQEMLLPISRNASVSVPLTLSEVRLAVVVIIQMIFVLEDVVKHPVSAGLAAPLLLSCEKELL
jgi:hypothetical protein